MNPITTQTRAVLTPLPPGALPFEEAMTEFCKRAGIVGELEEKATEEQLALHLRQHLEPVRCHANKWKQYQDGCWRELDATTIEGAALGVIAASKRSARRATEVVKHLRMLLNADAEPDYVTFVIDEPGRTLLNCQNAVVAVSADKIEVLPHSPTYNFTKQIVTAWDPAAACPTFRRVLKATLPDLDCAALFVLFCGYALMKDCRFQCCLLMVGPGLTGKSTLLKAIRHVLGPDLVAGVSLSDLCDWRAFALPTLKDKALNITTELDAKVSRTPTAMAIQGPRSLRETSGPAGEDGYHPLPSPPYIFSNCALRPASSSLTFGCSPTLTLATWAALISSKLPLEYSTPITASPGCTPSVVATWCRSWIWMTRPLASSIEKVSKGSRDWR